MSDDGRCKCAGAGCPGCDWSPLRKRVSDMRKKAAQTTGDCGPGYQHPFQQAYAQAAADAGIRLLEERDQLLAALTDLHRVALFIHSDEYVGDCKICCAIAAAERLIAGDKTE